MADYDAIIVGAGPAGSSLAARLAKNGFQVLLADRSAFPRDKACGEYTSPETEKVLARLGLFEAVLRAGARRLPAMRVISPSGHSFSMEYAAPGDESSPHVLATPRRTLDAILVDHARACGAEVVERAHVDGVVMRDGQAAGVMLREAGKTREERARIVVGADGVHSVVVRSLGLAAPLKWPKNLGIVAHYKGHKGLDDWGEMHVSSRGYAGLAPLSDGLLNVGLVMPLRQAKSSDRGGSAARFEAFARSFPGVARVLDGAERVSKVRGVGPIGARVKRTSGPGYLLVGDAAGFFDPFTGEGVYKALRGAELAAEVATDALERNDLSARSLSLYSAMRRKEFTAKDLVCRLVQLFVDLPPAMNYVVSRLSERASPRQVLTGVLGDFVDARRALSPLYLWSLLRP